MRPKPRVLITLGDVAGIGPEIVVRAWHDPYLHTLCVPVVVGDVETVRRTAEHLGVAIQVTAVGSVPPADLGADIVPCIQGTDVALHEIVLGRVSPFAGRAAYDFIVRAVELIQGGQAQALVTLPIHKRALHLAGISEPGHTEILARLTGCHRYAMMLYYQRLGITHVTLHMALRDALQALSIDSIVEKAELSATCLAQLLDKAVPELAVCALNPHAGEEGLFGDEEARYIRPAVELAQRRGLAISGPWPADTLFYRAFAGAYDGVIAMYHDQGHIPMKLRAGYRAVNITLGLPLIRTSVAHGTAYDVAGQGVADPMGFVHAVEVAARLASAQAG